MMKNRVYPKMIKKNAVPERGEVERNSSFFSLPYDAQEEKEELVVIYSTDDMVVSIPASLV